MSRITLLGLGAMGQRMARRLLAAGHELTVWNRTPEAAQSFIAAGARTAATPRQAAEGADIVLSMVFDDDASRSLWLDPSDGVVNSLSPSAIAIESSTLSPAWVQQLGENLAARGVSFLDAPVAGSRPQAEAGQLVFMVGGDASTLDKVRPVLATLGSSVHHMGPVGSGAWLKLSVNTLFATQVVAMAEQLGLLRRAGLDPQRALEALRAMPVLSPTAAGAGTLMLAANYAPQAPVDLIIKDLGYALAAGEHSGASLPITGAVAARFMDAKAAGMGGENLVAVAKLYH